MSIIRIAPRERNYTTISNYPLRDPSLSFKATGVLATLLSYPDNWNVNVKHLAGLKSDGETSVKSALKELREAGYIKKIPVKDDKGRISHWESFIYETPQKDEEIQKVENPPSGNPDSGKPGRLINTYSNKDFNQVCNSRKSEADFYTPGKPTFCDEQPLEQEGLDPQEVLDPGKDLEILDPGKSSDFSISVNSSKLPIEEESLLDDPEFKEKGGGAKNFSSVSGGERATSAPNFAPRSPSNVLPRESDLIRVWNANKAQKWRAMALGSISGSSILGLQAFMLNANGDPSEAVRLIERCIQIASDDQYFKGLNLRSGQALDPNSQLFLGHFIGDALASLKSPAPVAAIPTPTAEPIPKPTFYFDRLLESVRNQLQTA